MNLFDLRTQISNIDSELLTLFEKRLQLTHQVGLYKKEKNLPVFDPDREKDIIANIRDSFSPDPSGIESLWRELMYISKREQSRTIFGSNDSIRIGIMGGKGSFNEIAIRTFLDRTDRTTELHTLIQEHPSRPVEIVYLYTTERVLEALNSWSIDFGIFGISNSIGGLVGETFEVLGKYRWKQLATEEISVHHALMIHLEASIEDISIIMGHDQAIRQCEQTLETLFPQIPKVSGTGEYMDNAAIAEWVATGKLPRHIASIGHESLAQIYGLTVERKNIQDRSDNRTTFLIVQRYI